MHRGRPALTLLLHPQACLGEREVASLHSRHGLSFPQDLGIGAHSRKHIWSAQGSGVRERLWEEQNSRREEEAGSYRNLGYQAAGKMQIMTELAGCGHPMPTTLCGFPLWRGGGLPSSLCPSLLWPLGVGNTSENPSRFTSTKSRGIGF